VIVPFDSRDLVSRLREVLLNGGTAIVPCDTMYGIIGVVPQSEARIRALKGRGEEKPFLQLVADSSWIRRISGFDVPPSLARHWPGPLTLVIPGNAVRSGECSTIALRVPDSAFLRELMLLLDRPVYSTSVNRAGKSPLWKISEISAEFGADVDIIVDAGDLAEGHPSTILDVTSRPFIILRQGALEIPPADLV
jgi:L-threonylcarbamoyladenylate synthase